MRFFLLFTWFLSLVAQPATAASTSTGGLGSLEQQLSELVAGRSGEYGIAALDLGSGATVSINGDQPFPMASTVKVAIAAAYLAQVDHGRRTLQDRISGQSAAQLIDLMLVHSDNIATDKLLRNLGGPATIHQWVRFNGFDGIRVDRNIATLLSDKRNLRDLRDSSTPIAMVNLLKRIDGGNILSASSRRLLLETMRRCATGRNRIRGLLPFGTTVEHKTGTLDGLTDDVGFITLPDGRRIVIAIFGRGGNDRPRTIAEAARAVYDAFAAVSWRSFAPTTAAR